MKKIRFFGLCFFIVISFLGTACSKKFEDKKDENGVTNKEKLEYDKIYKGILIEGTDVSDLTKDEALNRLKSSKESEYNNPLEFVYKDQSFAYKLSNIGFKYNFEKAIDIAYEVGRIGSDKERIEKIDEVRKNNLTLPLERKIDENEVKGVVSDLAAKINKKPVNELYKFDGNKFTVEDGKEGIKVNEENLINLIKDFKKGQKIEVPVETVAYNKIDRSKVDTKTGVIGQATTRYNQGIVGRSENIRLSTKALNDVVINPGQTISFNRIVGDTSPSRGYKIAKIIQNGKLVEGLGGGVCQTSTTLYQAAIKADLVIVDRSHHSLPITYTPKGLDAAIFYNTQDLKIKNPFNFPVVIKGYSGNGSVTFKILGDTSVKNYEVSFYSEVVKTIPMPRKEVIVNNLKPGERVVVQQGRPEYKSNRKIFVQFFHIAGKNRREHRRNARKDLIVRRGRQIGRASCRERV